MKTSIGKLSLVLSLFLIGAMTSHAQSLLSEVFIQANPSQDTYDVLHSYLGANNEIESPDLYSNNHPDGGRHITQIAGAGPQGQAAFEFILHTAGPDYDKGKGPPPGSKRARCEIKGDGGSPSTIMAYQNDIMRFEWYFRADPNYSIAGNDIIMQLHHSVVGPVVRLHLHTKNGGVLEALYQTDSEGAFTVLGQVPFAALRGQWLRVECVAKFSEGNSGYLKYKVWDQSGNLLINFLDSSIDMWTPGEWNRPKWGIYAPFTNPGQTQRIRFADLKIQKWSAIPSDSNPPAAPSTLNLIP